MAPRSLLFNRSLPHSLDPLPLLLPIIDSGTRDALESAIFFSIVSRLSSPCPDRLDPDPTPATYHSPRPEIACRKNTIAGAQANASLGPKGLQLLEREPDSTALPLGGLVGNLGFRWNPTDSADPL